MNSSLGLLLCIAFCAVYGAACSRLLVNLEARRERADYALAFAGFTCLAASSVCAALSGALWMRFISVVLFLVLFIFSGLVFLAHAFYRKSGRAFHIEDIIMVMQTDATEARDFLKSYVLVDGAPMRLAAGGALLVAGYTAILLILGPAFSAVQEEMTGTVALLTAAFVLCGIVLLFRVGICREAIQAARSYRTNIARFLQGVRELERCNDQCVKKIGTGERYVIVVGESQCRDHMHAYTGVIENTPWLDSVKDSKGWHLFQNAYASHTQTIYCIPQALTDGRSLTGVTFPHCQNMLTISRLAGMKTAWISNQSDLSHFSSTVTAMAHLADRVVFSEKFSDTRNPFQETPPDEVLLPLLAKELALDPDENKLIIVHLMGNHIPYLARLPRNFPCRVWKGCRYLGNMSKNTKVAERFSYYAASIAYTDQVLAAIAAMLEEEANRPSCLIYFSDHGDDIAAEGAPHDYAHFTWPMARIPLFVHTSPGYEALYPEKCRTLAANKDKIFTNDLLYDLYLGLAGLPVQSYEEKYDPSAAAYSLGKDNAILAGGKKVAEDPVLHIPDNAAFAGSPLLGAHRCNSLFKLRQVQRFGIRDFEVDLLYLSSAERDDLFVGHDTGNLAGGLCLDEYLRWLGPDYDFLWLDIKNLNQDTGDDIFALLYRLDKKYALRSRTLVEAMVPAPLGLFAKTGWSTSLFVTTDSLRQLASARDEEKARVFFAEIARQVQAYAIKGVSYDLQYDHLIREFLLPVLPEGCICNSWRHAWKYTDKDLLNKIRRYPHLARLLVSFDTLFDL